MKKVLSAIGIFIISLIITFGMLAGNALVYVLAPVPGFYLLLLVVPFLAAFGTSGLCKKFCGKYHIKAWSFWVLAFLPQLIAGAVAAAVIYLALFSVKYNGVWSFWFNCYFVAAIGVPYGISGAIFTYLSAKKLKEERQ